MSKPIFSSEMVYDGYLRVNSCGKQWLNNRDYDTLRPNGRIDYSVNYILKGAGYCEIDGKIITVSEGCLMFFAPNTKQHYIFKKTDAAVMLWSHFSGYASEMLNKCIDSSVATIKIHDRKQFESVFDKMILAYYKNDKFFDTACAGYMAVLLSLMAQSVFADVPQKTKVSNENLEKVLSIMHLEYNRPINIKEYAKICCIGEEHFIRVFKAYTGLPPYHYQLRIRINRAIHMLENTSITIKECAEMVGFTDTAYFSKIFKRFTGVSPSNYKK